MAHNPSSKRGGGAPSRASPDDTSCEFKDDPELRKALVSRDLRIVGCRLVTVAGVVRLALYMYAGSMVVLIARMLGRLQHNASAEAIHSAPVVFECPVSRLVGAWNASETDQFGRLSHGSERDLSASELV